MAPAECAGAPSLAPTFMAHEAANSRAHQDRHAKGLSGHFRSRQDCRRSATYGPPMDSQPWSPANPMRKGTSESD